MRLSNWLFVGALSGSLAAYGAQLGLPGSELRDTCQALGDISFRVAEGRDAGVPVDQVKARLKSLEAENPDDVQKAVMVWLYSLVDNIYLQKRANPSTIATTVHGECMKHSGETDNFGKKTAGPARVRVDAGKQLNDEAVAVKKYGVRDAEYSVEELEARQRGLDAIQKDDRLPDTAR